MTTTAWVLSGLNIAIMGITIYLAIVATRNAFRAKCYAAEAEAALDRITRIRTQQQEYGS